MINNKWNITEDNYEYENNYLNETLFALGNGYIGTRGSFEEGDNKNSMSSFEGTFINGFYESKPIYYEENAYGYARNNQVMLNVTNGKLIRIYLEDEKFSLLEGKILKYNRTLDMKKGILKRHVIWRSPKGKEIEINITRMVSLINKNLMVIEHSLIPLNFSGSISIISELQNPETNEKNTIDPRAGARLTGDELKILNKGFYDGLGYVKSSTANSNKRIMVLMDNEISGIDRYDKEEIIENNGVKLSYSFIGREHEKVNLVKYVSYFTENDCSIEEIKDKSKDFIGEIKKVGIKKLLKEQESFLENYWEKSLIDIEGSESLAQGITFNQFHLLQSVGRDGKTNIGAKGLTGEGYEGHYFWDTEIYVIPYFLYTMPEISRDLLKFRYSILPKARERAKDLGHFKGALYPWRTINGEECSSYYPGGTAQYHINADITYAIKKYVEATEDIDFLLKYGAEIVFETSRLWESLGVYSQIHDNKFIINGVTGPDEYTAIVNNNYYTNSMAKMNLEYGVYINELLEKYNRNAYEKLKKKIGLSDDEIDKWKEAAEKMYLPYDEKNKVFPQDDSFLQKKIWDIANTPKNKFPLLLHYHPLVIYRHQVCKQPDVVLDLFLQGNKYTLEEKKNNYNYYEKVTTHDSSLSYCIFSIMASEIGEKEKAWDYFIKTSRMDLDNYAGNTEHGVHIASMAGTWMSIVNGFGGMRCYNGSLYFNPYLPEGLSKYSFNVFLKSNRIKVTVYKNKVIYSLLEGKDTEIYHYNKKIKLDYSKDVELII